MIKKSFDKILKKYQSGSLDESATRFVARWYESLDNLAGHDPLENKAKAALIKNTIHANLLSHIQQKRKLRFISPWYYAAACLVMATFTIFIIQKSDNSSAVISPPVYTVIKTNSGRMKKITLPDSSVVWINAGSVLRYNAKNFILKREIFLDDGEAFFTVVKDRLHPFSVHAQSIATKVLGTSFNVKAYKKLSYASVQVKTGKVQVRTGKQKFDTVTVAQSITYDKETGKTTKNINEQTNPGSWVEGITVLHEATFSELALVMLNRYQVQLKTNNTAIYKHHYTINISEQKPTDEIIKLICAIHQNKYRKDKNEIIIY